MNKKVLVTGGAGFIGSHVADRYIREGYSVVVLDNLSTGFKENVNPEAKFYLADITDRKKVREILESEKPDYVNHHAAQMDVRKSVDDPVFDARTNILGSVNLMLESLQSGVAKFIYISTGGAVYGEPDSLPVDETYPVNPLSPYGVSKHTVEHYLYLFAHNAGFRYTVLRYANVYGPRQNPHGEAGVVAIFTEKMLGGETPTIFGAGTQTRDYVYVEDVVEASVLSIEKGDGGIYNLGTGQETSVIGLFESLKGILGFDGEPSFAPARTGEIERISLDAGKAARELGWKPGHTLEQGFQKTVTYYREK
jgi:UDP-glucose 4-epimerase